MSVDTPIDYTRVAMWISGAYSRHMWQECSDSAAIVNNTVNAGQKIGIIDEQVACCRIEGPSLSASPTLAAGSLHAALISFANVSYLTALNSVGALRFIHGEQSATITGWFKRISTASGATEMIFDNAGGSTGSPGAWQPAGSFGCSCYIDSTHHLVFFLCKGTSGTPAITLTSSATYNNTTEHYFQITIAQGSNACTIKVDGTTVATGTIAGTQPAVTQDAAFDIRFGANANSGLQKFNGMIGEVVFIRGAIVGSDLTHWLAFNPAITTDEVNKVLASPGYTTLQPSEHSGLVFDKCYTSDIGLIYQANDTVTPAVPTSKVGRVSNLKPMQSNCDSYRHALQSNNTVRPTFTASIINGLSCVVFAGSSADPSINNFTGENTLSYDQWGYGGKTWICMYRQTDPTYGSHLFRTNNAGYFVPTGTNYLGGGRGDIVVHSQSRAFQSIPLAFPEGVNVVVLRIHGSAFQLDINGVRGETRFAMDNLIPTYTGRPKNPNFDLKGSIFRELLYNNWITDENAIDGLVKTMIAQYGQPTQPYKTFSGGSSGSGYYSPTGYILGNG